MKTLFSTLLILDAIFVAVDHVRPCRHLGSTTLAAIERGHYLDALEIPHRLLVQSPCFCTGTAKSGLTLAFEQSMTHMLQSEDPDLNVGAEVIDRYHHLAQEHGIPDEAQEGRVLSALGNRAIAAARAKADRGDYASALRMLKEVDDLRPTERADAKREENRLRLQLALSLWQNRGSEEALYELARVVQTDEPDVRKRARTLAESVSQDLVGQRLRSKDFGRALKTIDQAHEIVLDDGHERLLNRFDREAYGRLLRGKAPTHQSNTERDTSAEMRIHNAAKTTLQVVFRGPSQVDVTVAANANKSVRLKPGEYVIGAYAPSDPLTGAYRGITQVHYGYNFSGFTQAEGTELTVTNASTE